MPQVGAVVFLRQRFLLPKIEGGNNDAHVIKDGVCNLRRVEYLIFALLFCCLLKLSLLIPRRVRFRMSQLSMAHNNKAFVFQFNTTVNNQTIRPHPSSLFPHAHQRIYALKHIASDVHHIACSTRTQPVRVVLLQLILTAHMDAVFYKVHTGYYTVFTMTYFLTMF
jgi:hypothetical protein